MLETRGGIAVPAFRDAHTHLCGAALATAGIPLEDVVSIDEMLARVTAHTASTPPQGWLLGRGWTPDRMAGLPGSGDARTMMPRRLLDQAASDRAVLLVQHDGHSGWASSAALEAAGLDLQRSDGVVVEADLEAVRAQAPVPTASDLADLLTPLLQEASRLGLCCLEDDPSYDSRVEALAPQAYALLVERGECPVRIRLWRRLGRDPEDLAAEDRGLRERLSQHPDTVRFGALKAYLDGSLGSRTAWLLEPYVDPPAGNPCAGPIIDLASLPTRLREAFSAHHDVALHAIGDAAVRAGLDAFEQAPRPANGPRARLEHVQMVAAADVPRFAALDVVASVQPVHLETDVLTAPRCLGAERAAQAYPYRTLLEAGATLAMGTDYPIEDLDPRRGLRCAVTRTSASSPDQGPLGANQALSPAAALAAYTRAPAATAGEGDRDGTLAPGASADLIILGADPFDTQPDDWLEIPITTTVVGGRVVSEESPSSRRRQRP